MLVPIWSHQISTSYLGAAIGPSDDGRPFSEIWPKTHDGMNLMSTWDVEHRWAISGPDALADFARYQADNGRNVRPWCVVKGNQPEAEGRLAAEMAQAAASANLTRDAVIIIDLEPYYHGGAGNPQFWRSDLWPAESADRARRLLDAFADAGGQTAWIAGDVRSAHLAVVSYETWARHPVVSVHSPQTYFSIFDGDLNTSIERARMHIDRANNILAGYGVEPGRIGHILPAEGNPDVLVEAYGYCHSLGQLKPSIWQRVNITPGVVSALASAADPWHAAPPPPPRTSVGRETRIEPIKVEAVAEGVRVFVDWGEVDEERFVRMFVPVEVTAKVRLVRDD